MNTRNTTAVGGPEKGNFSCFAEWGSVGRRHQLETAWDVSLFLAIFVTNAFIIFIIRQSHSLWKPRHLLMATLCVANLLLGLHQLYSLGLELWPHEKLCIIYRMTIGVPVQVCSLLSVLISVDRFVAVQFPFFYGSSVNNFRVLLCSASVIAIAAFLTAVLSFLGFMYPLIQLSTWLMFLPLTLIVSSVLILYCNATVLMAARRKMSNRDCRRVVVGYNYLQCESTELLGTILTARTDDSDDVNSPSISTQCSFIQFQRPGVTLISSCGSMTRTDENVNESQKHLMQNEPKALCVQRRSHLLHFVRAVITMNVPVFIFFIPIILIIPLKYANDSGWCDLDQKMDVLWNFLLIHFRSIVPLQCAIDPLVYLKYSKESRRSSRFLIRRWWSKFFHQQKPRETFAMAQM